jgi:hypothetical protein
MDFMRTVDELCYDSSQIISTERGREGIITYEHIACPSIRRVINLTPVDLLLIHLK